MFNKKDASSEIASSMESNLITHVIEKRAEQMNKFAKALDYLNSVAEIFDELGLRGEAEATTTLLEVVAAKKSKKKSKTKSKSKKKSRTRKSDSVTKGLTSNKMENNLKEKGWVFNADDNFVEDPDELYSGTFDLEDDYESDHGLFEGTVPAERGRLHRDDPYAPGGVYDKVERLEDWEDADDNYHYDTESDSSYHIDRLDVKDYDPYDKDEKEQDLARRFHELLEQDEDSLFDKQDDLEDDLPPPRRRHRGW